VIFRCIFLIIDPPPIYTPIENPRTTDEQTLTDWGDKIMERHANDVPVELRDEAVKNVLQPWSEDIRSRKLGLELLKEELELIAAPLQKLTTKLSRVQQAGSSKKKGQPKPKEITAWGAEQRQLTQQSKAMTIQVVAAQTGLSTSTAQMHQEVPRELLISV